MASLKFHLPPLAVVDVLEAFDEQQACLLERRPILLLRRFASEIIESVALSACAIATDCLRDMAIHHAIAFVDTLAEYGIRLGSRLGVDFLPVIFPQHFFSQYENFVF